MERLFFIMVWCCMISFTTAAQIGKAQQGNAIAGIWVNSQYGYQMTLMLNADGSGEFDGDVISYTVSNGKLIIKQQGLTNTYTFSRQGNALTLSGGDLDEAIVFTRQGTSPQEQPATSTSVASSTGATGNQQLLGVWSGNGETIEFKSNGQCIYLNQTYGYQAAGGTLTLQTAQGNVSFGFEVAGNQLHLRGNGQTVTYTKGNSSSAPATTTNNNGRMGQELVGKWCWANVTTTNSGGSSSEQCITLNADGTYQYYGERSSSVNTNAYAGGTASQSADRGTWTYDGSRIYYTSSAGNGSGSYRLEKRNHPKTGDPMIVLDGATYVTYYQKAPWR
jgi:hypothetical protein